MALSQIGCESNGSGDNGEEAAGGETMGDGAEAADFRKWEGDGMVEGTQMTGVRRVE